jgi:FkbM family methyltransferase
MNAIYLPSVPFESLYIPHILKEIYIDKVFSRLKPCDVIVDVGANIGLTAMYLKDFGKKVYALEPETLHYEALCMNARRWENVSCYKRAISHKNGFARLSLNSENRTMNSLVWDGYDGETVMCQTFIDFMAEFRIEQIDFCKLDVEGAEGSILLSGGFISVAPRIKSLLIEFHDQRAQSLCEHMENLGYNWHSTASEANLFWFER